MPNAATHQFLSSKPPLVDWVVAINTTPQSNVARWQYVAARLGAEHAERIAQSISVTLPKIGAANIFLMYRGERWASLAQLLQHTPAIMRMFREELEERRVVKAQMVEAAMAASA